MRIPLTKYGWPQVVVIPVVVLLAMAVFAVSTMALLEYWSIIAVEGILFIMLIFVLMFFRDPHRVCPADEDILFAPADGKITEIEQVEENGFIDRPVLRIGIFLSLFNTHINRAPCNVRIETITYKEGRYRNAMNPQSGRVNESNTLGLVRTDPPKDKLIVRQISGAIARRIVCDTAEGQELAGGQKFGMLKFGSRTELYVPISSCVMRDAHCEKKEMDSFESRNDNTQYTKRNTQYEIKCLVRIGDKVKAGLTPLVKYEEKSKVKV